MNVSAKGIIYDLPLSHYNIEYENVKFFFSSILYLEKFNATIQNTIEYHIKKFENSLPIFCSLIVQYYKTEKRGFYIEKGGEKYTCLEQIIFAGVNRTN